ncbi:hypothetical protein HG535_0D04280 [Zygotorulaspora mrakii]|uniref:Uncharacterized protein n=1 Tax=Zygotorulaspora mrakii TaxID=42260 RepID=A0A7H9B281_ZYGMR|nr:uncharacterized protein HG535_0D04280 [Zygotorulaspora mrakii]QLG72720.1 hypothetical protein HG535_0D04280 [Zygotorulaspora mrakii]
MAKIKQRRTLAVNEDGTILSDPPKSIGNAENFQRMNYLYQLSMWQTAANRQDTDQGLSRMYIKNMDLVSKKTKSSLLPYVKRTFCKKCHRVLVPKRTVQMTLKQASDGKDILVWECRCGYIKKFPIGTNRSYRTFYDKPENLLHM